MNTIKKNPHFSKKEQETALTKLSKVAPHFTITITDEGVPNQVVPHTFENKVYTKDDIYYAFIYTKGYQHARKHKPQATLMFKHVVCDKENKLHVVYMQPIVNVIDNVLSVSQELELDSLSSKPVGELPENLPEIANIKELNTRKNYIMINKLTKQISYFDVYAKWSDHVELHMEVKPEQFKLVRQTDELFETHHVYHSLYDAIASQYKEQN